MRWLWRADPPFQQSQFQPNPKPVAAERHIIWLAATLVALSGLAVATTLYVLRGEALHTGKKLTRSLAQVIEEQTSRTLQAADQRLQLAAVRLDALKTERQLNRDTADAMLREQLKELPFASAIWVLDQDGRIAFDSTPGNTAVSLADRDYFKVYQQRPDAGFYVSAPVRSRTNNRWIVAVARPLRTLAGGFSGAARMWTEIMYPQRRPSIPVTETHR